MKEGMMGYYSDKVVLSEILRITAGVKNLAVIAKDNDFILNVSDDKTDNAIYLSQKDAAKLVAYINAHLIISKND